MKSKVYTKTGDKGTTGLVGGKRVDKDDVRIECLGEIDEANTTIGLLRSKLGLEHEWQLNFQRIQTELMNCMAHIATPSDSKQKCTLPLPEDSVAWAEQWMDEIETKASEPSKYFLLPTGDEIAALCHVVRTQIRRSERRLISLHKIDPVHESILLYVNRLSDLFFLLAREALQASGIPEEKWELFRYDPKKK